MRLKFSSAKRWPFILGLNVLMPAKLQVKFRSRLGTAKHDWPRMIPILLWNTNTVAWFHHGNKSSPDIFGSLQWRHGKHDGVKKTQSHDCSLSRWFRRRPKKTSKLHVTGLCQGNSTVTGVFPVQRASNAENVFIWWRHHAISKAIDGSYLKSNGAKIPIPTPSWVSHGELGYFQLKHCDKYKIFLALAWPWSFKWMYYLLVH